MKRGDSVSELHPVVERLVDIAEEQGIPEPRRVETVIFDDGTFEVNVYHVFDDGGREERLIQIEDGQPVFDEFGGSDADGVGITYRWSPDDNDVLYGKVLLSGTNFALYDEEVVATYTPPVHVIEALQEREVVE